MGSGGGVPFHAACMTRNRVSGGSFSVCLAGLIVGENFTLGRVKLARQKSQRLIESR